MTDKKIKEYIDRLNNKKGDETIFIRQISSLVDVARVWDEEPKLNKDISISSLSETFFFIRNEENKYVGAVHDTESNLHWYVLENERKRGYLTKALKEAIMPYIFCDYYCSPRDTQRITIKYDFSANCYENSKKVAESIGFKSVNDDETEFELKKEEFKFSFNNLEEINKKISSERLLILRKRLDLSCRQLFKISDEFLMAYDNDNMLRQLVEDIREVRIQDIEL
ncbi:hypothetical protein V8G69_05760 [Gaetbulibacter sp. M235]|uniref:hypothetical protein n=1 Tax=Gaetbulibacter sp. M235 TaxID=3126510 RepID=UPI00374EA035